MREILLDARDWAVGSFYDAFFRAVGAPSWHGRNFDALRDSIGAGEINQIEVPYRLVIRNYAELTGPSKTITDDFVSLIGSLRDEGCNVEIRLE